ncbi:MAG: alcohol dehydrogenase catalytic domain-containing protein [Verrucomicrobia bacterium]|nr:alcohol dehydrogenase catalytic domain-containing protein [Verrucomicrobiota bacterium]
MLAARLHGPRDLRVESIPRPGPPQRGQALLRVLATGICGSDLHSYLDARIGDTPVEQPLILGHEFSAVVEAVGPESLDGNHQPLKPGTRVAVDPAQPCHHCEPCEHGHPNLCRNLAFCGNYPYGGSFCEWLLMPARSCFPVPKSLDDTEAALLEPLGVALHAVDLAKLRVGHSLAILGSGPIGLLCLQVAKLAGAAPIFVTDRLPWRLKLAERWGGFPIPCDRDDPVQRITKETHGRGVDVVIEAAWAGDTVGQAAEMTRHGGRVVLVGIPGDDQLALKHSTARRKGLTLVLSRRMKHCYPRALRLAAEGRVDLRGLVSHRFPLRQVVEAFQVNCAYRDGVVKVMVDGHR